MKTALVLAMAVALGISASAPRVRAANVPACGGHVTDPDRVLAEPDRQALTAELDKLDLETLIDVAVWVADAPDDSLPPPGQKAFGEWSIGRVWDGGLLIVAPTSGRAVMFQDPKRPVLTPTEVDEVTGADRPDEPMIRRLDAVCQSTASVLRRRIDRYAPARRLRYVFVPAALLLAAAALMARDRRNGNASPPG